MPRVFIQKGTRKYTGPSLQSILEQNRGLKVFVTKSQMASMLRFAGKVGGELWLTVFLPKRFEMDYARNLGYSGSARYGEWKAANVGKTVQFGGKHGTLSGKTTTVAAPQPSPYYLSGDSKKTVLSSAYVTVTATSEKVVIKVKFRLGNIAFNMADSFTKVPAFEYARVVQEVDRVLRLRIKQEFEKNGEIDQRILDFGGRGEIPADMRHTYAPFMEERKAI